ncbi:DUF3307 domain-containing protein [Streptomyces roseolus]|uniref:DUF3307 domain-containing protein n=1 Tax=Streptomyces roseolus TaxID=67358 RepID=UPI003799DB01
MNTTAGTRFAAAHTTLTAAHHIGDYVLQRDADAAAKGKHGPDGALACARHVLSYAAGQALALWAADRYLGLGLNRRRAAVGLLVSGATHYAIDRCATHWPEDDDQAPLLVRAAHKIGKGTWLQRDPSAPALLDQALHHGCIAVAAAVAAGRPD